MNGYEIIERLYYEWLYSARSSNNHPIIIQYHSYRTMNGKLMGQGPENRCSSAMATENWEIPLGRCLIPIVLHGLYNCKHVSQGET